jgi:hypothetical protein
LVEFAGRGDLAELAGALTGRVLKLAATVTAEDDDRAASSADDWLALADLPGPHLWRDPTGRYEVVSLSDVEAPYVAGMGGRVATVSLTATRVGRA